MIKTEFFDLNIAVRNNGHFKKLSRFIFYPNLIQAYRKSYSDRFGVTSWDCLDYQEAIEIAQRVINNAKRFPQHIKVQGTFIDQTFKEEDAVDRLFKGEKVVL